MAQEKPINLSVDDNRCITMSHLGSPLAMYRSKQVYIQIYYWMSLILFLIGISIGVLIMFTHSYFPPLIGLMISLLVSYLLWGVIIPQARYNHVIICERGLLYGERYIKSSRIQTVYWEDIQDITQDWSYSNALLSYLQDTVPKTLVFSFTLDNLDELIMQIRQKTNISIGD